ncbi:hypothetical protein LTR62_005342 [Meristemomyces frigidus]|uniref:Uncharacterized protein n=1 Tax=Meristemomyces frigidus TaxID=1508187 RepID=A0AAN7TDI9_9PEZI|nr:hypothetical protein LTR62_005342 [Meristemomyces frigidus]
MLDQGRQGRDRICHWASLANCRYSGDAALERELLRHSKRWRTGDDAEDFACLGSSEQTFASDVNAAGQAECWVASAEMKIAGGTEVVVEDETWLIEGSAALTVVSDRGVRMVGGSEMMFGRCTFQVDETVGRIVLARAADMRSSYDLTVSHLESWPNGPSIESTGPAVAEQPDSAHVDAAAEKDMILQKPNVMVS